MQGCALTKLECNDPTSFASAREMRDTGVRGHGGECRWMDIVKSTQLGMCFESESTTAIDCATTVEACNEWDLKNGIVHNSSSGFVPKMPECTVENTKFGRCSDGMCAWDPKHCLDDHSWTPFDQECTCDEVQVGACSRNVMRDGVEGREVFCAVSEDACDSQQTWIKPRDVKGMAGFDCFLCREESSLPPTRPPSTKAPEAGNDQGGFVEAISSRTTVIIVASTGGAVALLILAMVGFKLMGIRKTNNAAAAAAMAKMEVPPPLSDIQIPSETDPESGGPSVNAAIDADNDDDNASVLSYALDEVS